MSLHTLFHYLQECAYLNALSNGFGYEFLEKENAYWVLTRVKVEMDEFPKWNDKIQIKTWPRSVEGLFAVRDYLVLRDGQELGRVSSYWMVISKATRRPLRIDGFNFVDEEFETQKAIESKLEKIETKGDFNLIDNRKVYSSDIDVNGHVNNATYVRWILDASQASPEKRIKVFEINFIKELLFGDEFSVWVSNEEKNEIIIIKNSNLKDVCIVKIARY